ncbi:hypothetical protein RND71_015616 [Anisodus tanguticus]|uniref:Uncharacterized protein n=1 Tax=Anisodus tanguticus TaxID=243964 RepID=A0AAE1S5Y8_9SOLA|nr:hypothetical protein RND71_015616 [Anisodus tanguticus]
MTNESYVRNHDVIGMIFSKFKSEPSAQPASPQRGPTGLAGVGMVPRDHLGQFIVGKTIFLGRVASPLLAEIIGVREALTWLKDFVSCGLSIEARQGLGFSAIIVVRKLRKVRTGERDNILPLRLNNVGVVYNLGVIAKNNSSNQR